MTANNLEFVITGDNQKNETQLNPAIDFILKSYEFTPVSCHYRDDVKLVFYTSVCENSKDMNNIYHIDKDQSQDSDFICKLVELYLMTSKYKNALFNIPRMDDMYDGHSSAGWKITLDLSSICNQLLIEPFWIFYYK
jgi:hypothetical protein